MRIEIRQRKSDEVGAQIAGGATLNMHVPIFSLGTNLVATQALAETEIMSEWVNKLFALPVRTTNFVVPNEFSGEIVFGFECSIIKSLSECHFK